MRIRMRYVLGIPKMIHPELEHMQTGNVVANSRWRNGSADAFLPDSAVMDVSESVDRIGEQELSSCSIQAFVFHRSYVL